MISKKNINYILFIISLLGYFFLYYEIDRSEFFKLILGVSVLGAIYFYWLKTNALSIKQIVIFAVIFRGVLLFDNPNFSDDCYRFVWDGNLIVQGENPYEKTPAQIMQNKEDYSIQNLPTIYEDLNSQQYFTVYPPLNQFFFSSAVYLSGNNVFLPIFYMKLFILLFEIGLLFLLFRMLRKLKLKENLAQIYALNPLVIIELTGNVHFEGIMVFFLILGLYFILLHRVILASLFIGFAISVKVIPLLLLPLFLPLLGFKNSVKLYACIGLTSVLLVLPFISQTVVDNFSQSLNLYFQTFEFNASFYYLFKNISYLLLGYKSSLIGTITPIIIFCTAIFFALLLYRKKGKETSDFDLVLFAKYASSLLLVFYLLASTVHPWYAINLLIFSVFFYNQAFVLWTILSFLSYFAYSNFVIDFAPNGDFHSYGWYYVLIAFQYGILLFLFIFEKRKKTT
ncbi:MAG: hypothetical protein ABF242_10890 [Flavobacteriales bacterium]